MLVHWPVVHVLLWVEVHYICTFLVGDGIMYILRAVWYIDTNISTFKVGTKVTSAGNSAPLTYEWLYLGFMVLTVIYFHMESLTRFLERVRTQLDISVIHSSTSHPRLGPSVQTSEGSRQPTELWPAKILRTSAGTCRRGLLRAQW